MPSQPYESESVCAILRSEHGRFLMQLRDDGKPIVFPGYWGMFGGQVEPGEKRHVAIRRELAEEIGFVPERLTLLTSYVYQLARPAGLIRWERESVYIGAIPEASVPGLVQTEGAGLQLWRLDDLLRQSRVVPLHAAALMLLERQGAAYGTET